MIEVLSRGRKEVEPEGPSERDAKNRIGEQPANDDVGYDLDRVLVEGGGDLDPARRVVDLMEHSPESVNVTESMPPVIDERAEESSDEALSPRRSHAVEMEECRAAEDNQPHLPGAERHGELHEVRNNARP